MKQGREGVSERVTAVPRIDTDACGPGTGLVGDFLATGAYVGRLPQLKAPYKLCGLDCHAINCGVQQRTDDGSKILDGCDGWQIRDQPTVEAYMHLDDYEFQIMVWEDDVWYMELVLYPRTEDAYKVIANAIFDPKMKDFDERELKIHALYHKTQASPDLKKHAPGDPFYWNFLEMEFDPSKRERFRIPSGTLTGQR